VQPPAQTKVECAFPSISWRGSALMLVHHMRESKFERGRRLLGEGFRNSLGRLGASPVARPVAFADTASGGPAQDSQFRGRVGRAVRAILPAGVAVLALATLLALAAPAKSVAQGDQASLLIRGRNVEVSRAAATQAPRTEGDQALADGWPLYRTERGQEAFNDAMATLRATDGTAPAPGSFKSCVRLACNLSLPALGAEGWIPPGRIWVSPAEYVLIVRSPRLREGQSYRRRAPRDMRYFVFHEFHNSTRNTDPFDTISSHSGSVFVPFYMSKQWTDARGRRFVIVLQVAPYDVVSFHATDKGSAGPGMEVAKNMTEELEPLQALAGIVIATILKTAAPQLEVVNHGGNEGLPMLNEYEHRLETLRAHPGAPAVALPFAPARIERVAAASGRLEDLIVQRPGSAPIPIAERGIVPPRAASSASASLRSASLVADPGPTLVEPIRPATRPPPQPEPRLVEPIRPATRPARESGG